MNQSSDGGARTNLVSEFAEGRSLVIDQVRGLRRLAEAFLVTGNDSVYRTLTDHANDLHASVEQMNEAFGKLVADSGKVGPRP